VDTLFAEIIEARKAMKAAEQEARRREEEVAGELAEAYAELQAASAAIRGREQRLSGELEEARRELEEAADRIVATHAVEQALRGELEQSLAAETAARRQAQELLEENARLSVGYRELEARLSSAMETEQAVNAELRAQLTEARSRVATMDEEEQGLREELMASQRLVEVAAERETSLRLQLDRAGQRIAALEAREAARLGTERPAPPAASIHRLEVPVPEDRESRDSRSEEGGGLPSRAAGLAVEELERLVLAAGEGCKPAGGELADGQRPDDLKAIGGIGPVNERWLHGNGIYFYAQIAGWSPEEMAWVARHLPNFGKRVYRENWVRQAVELAGPDASTGADQRRRADRH
jgi:predicted flap endonuclease-1-like 5' DNA nuclease